MDSPHDHWDAAAWVSTDGLTWSRVTQPAFRRADDQATWRVIAGGPGLVALGYEMSGGDQDAAVWTSADRSTWDRIPPQSLRAEGDQEMCGMARGGPGVVIVGYERSGTDWDGAVWTSADGITWDRVAHDEAALGGDGDQSMTVALASGGRLVAVGWAARSGPGDAAVWVSPPPG
jgi:hypothetical protein